MQSVEGAPRAILMWRSFSHWVGGMGVLVFMLALLPMAEPSSMHLMKAESPGPSVGKLVPKVRSTAKILYQIYFVLTVVMLACMILTGCPLFDSINLTFATAGTGGFGVLDSSAAEYGGIDANKSILTALGISGLLSGLGGAVQVLGMSGRLSQFAGQEGFGFEGITVALIGSSNPIGCIFSGLFYGAMKYGGSKLSIVIAPSEVVDIIMGCVVLLIAIAHVFKYFVLKTAKKKEAK